MPPTLTKDQQYKALQQERADLIKEAAAIAAKGASRTEAETARFEEIEARIGGDGGIDEALADIDKVREWERTQAPASGASDDGRTIQIGDRPLRTNEPDPRKTNGFANLAEFARTVVAASRPGGQADARLFGPPMPGAAPTNYHQESGTAEGYMVPAQFREEIWSLVFNGQDVLNMVSPEPTESNAVELLADESTPWGSTGVQANWRSEAGQMTASKLTTERRLVRLHELYAFVLATDELLQDAPRLNARLTVKAADAIRWKASDAIVNGTGAGQPLGWFTSAAKVSVAKESGQAAATIVAANIAKMYSRLLPMNVGRAFWLANSDTIPQLMTMTIGDQPIWTPPNNFVNAPGGILLGRPVMLSEHAQTLGTQGDIHLVDPGGYYATNKGGGIDFASSIHLYFDYGVQAFRWTFRFGGQPFLEAAVSPANGSNTKSHFVVLATRA